MSIFIIPSDRVKNGDERLVVLNRVARSVVEAANGVCGTNHGQPELLVMRGARRGASRKIPATAKPVLRAIG